MIGKKEQNNTGRFKRGKTWPPSSNMAWKCVQSDFHKITSVMDRFTSSVQKTHRGVKNYYLYMQIIYYFIYILL